jgi:hypothetical protein
VVAAGRSLVCFWALSGSCTSYTASVSIQLYSSDLYGTVSK